MENLTVLVVAEGFALAQEIGLALRRQAVTVLGPAFDEHAAGEALLAGDVRLIVVDLDRQDGRGVELVGSVRSVGPVSVIASTSDPTPSVAAAVLEAGAVGLLPRGKDAQRLAGILRLAADGELAIPDDHLASLVDHLHATRVALSLDGVGTLTPRERQVLVLLCEGRRLDEMATMLGVSGSTVQAHIKSVFSKLRVHSQVEAVRVAWRAGLGVPVSA